MTQKMIPKTKTPRNHMAWRRWLIRETGCVATSFPVLEDKLAQVEVFFSRGRFVVYLTKVRSESGWTACGFESGDFVRSGSLDEEEILEALDELLPQRHSKKKQTKEKVLAV